MSRGTMSPAQATLAKRPKSPAAEGGVNMTDGHANNRSWFTLGRTKDSEEVRALDLATQQALSVAERRVIPFTIDTTTTASQWTVVAPGSLEREDVSVLVAILIDWVNDVLALKRIVVKDIVEDFYDGQILAELCEALLETGSAILGGIAMTEAGRRAKLRTALGMFNDALNLSEDEIEWSVDSIMSKDVISTLLLLVALIERYAPQKRLPPGVCIEVILVERTAESLRSHSVVRAITKGTARPAYSFDGYSYGDVALEDEDVFDKLFNEAPEKVDAVKTVLVKFANAHLATIGVQLNDLTHDLRSGVILLMLIQLLGNYFVPLGDYCIHPTTDDEQLRNVGLVVTLMYEQGSLSAKAKEHILPDDVVSGDLKSSFRLLYSLFRRYKNAPVKGQAEADANK